MKAVYNACFHVCDTAQKKLRDLPIRRKLILSFLALVIFPAILIGFFSFYRSSLLLKDKTEQYSKDILMETGNNIEVKLNEAKNLSFQIISNSQVQNVLENANKGFADEYSRIAAEKTIDAQIQSFISSDADIAAILIVSNSGEKFYLSPALASLNITDMEKSIMDKGKGSAIWFDTDPTTRNIAVGRAINSLVNQKRIGYVFVYLRENSIFNIYKDTELFKNGEFFIESKEKKIISYKDKKMLGQINELEISSLLQGDLSNYFSISKINGKNYYIAFRKIEGNSWRIIGLIPAVEYEKDIVWLRNWTIFVCMICCMLAVTLSIVLSGTISKPVRKLSGMMTKVGKGDFNVLSSYDSKDEMGMLSSQFEKMAGQVQQLIQEVYQEQFLKQKAELKSLQMQINPHFLYNTLESINWMARLKGAPEVSKMVKALGDLMRTSISGDDFVSINEETNNINNYLTIQKYRYGERFEVSIDMSPEIHMVKMPKLILQPIVENAIVHGIENIDGIGKIDIKGALKNGLVIIQVLDNGIGMNEDVASSLLSNKGILTQMEDHTHIGLLNIDRRIKLYYGKEYGISIHSKQGCGTSVILNFPMKPIVN
jgi:two-component system sensor histidine kinase YesM